MSAATAPTATALRVAATLFWLSGAGWLALAVRAASGAPPNWAGFATAFVVGIIDCAAGYAVRRSRRLGAALAGTALGMSLVTGLRAPMSARSAALLLLGVGLPLGFLVAAWRTPR